MPNSAARFTIKQTQDLFAPADWHPESHPDMPGIVAQGRAPAVYACAYCHLPNGQGRPENAALAGLPAAYIEQQVADMRSGARQPAWPEPQTPWQLMHRVALNATPEEIRIAARYFAALPMTPRVQVIETDRVPIAQAVHWSYDLMAGPGREPLAGRLIETTADAPRHALRDDTAGFVAYVPTGSVARGKALASTGIGGVATACTTCHGADLRGLGLAPPLAGRSPTYLLRQLLAFKAGTRATAAGQPMTLLAARLSLDDMVATVAYSASLQPTAATR